MIHRTRSPRVAAFFVATTLLSGLGAPAGAQITLTTDTSSTGAWNTSRWASVLTPWLPILPWTNNSNASFSEGNYYIAGMGGQVRVGNITLADDTTVSFTANTGTLATGNEVRTITVGANSLLDFGSQAFATSAGTGFVKNGAGVLALSGSAYGGDFVLNAGTAVARGADAFGNFGSNQLILNGGILASTGSVDFSNRFGGGITIGGDVQFGQLSSVTALADSSATVTFNNAVSLGNAHRTVTIGNTGRTVMTGVVSNTGTGGITLSAAPGATTGRFELLNTANTFTGPVTVTGGRLVIAGNGSLGNASNSLVLDGGALTPTAGSNPTIGAARTIYVGDAGGTIMLGENNAVLQLDGPLANRAGEVGSLILENAVAGGTLRLQGNASHTGGTQVKLGTLIVNGNHSAATGPVTVGPTSGAVLGGNGTIGGNTTINGGQLSAGETGAVGTLTFQQDLSFANSGTWLVDLVGDVNGSADRVNVGGHLDLSSATLSLAATGTYTNQYQYTIATYQTLSGTFAGLPEGSVFSGYQISYGNPGNRTITLTAVPEPGTIGLLSLMGAGLAGWGRWKRRKNRAVGEA